ncbi:MAG: hypothetical protein A2487_09060 [Candidatus Raymondbacteria bacterium RifOxyC12_full_50_8]|nr:MAG: hypothetical protein A2248_11685 [Candidatus Raymondbacteria bacterium RIFOXYA2_FULL_49_16]OGJ98883.1 MAG: hypothetical protein A2350_16290 [Candidatus Raymondbacteria bacterium RifOxyB12_full_50_8]OGK03791.1 MAG: hypothetical protein A2487_09060 [Candidatus Raymondbacteria bacterium RifOxyC12_full_50_8]OGP42088.1 MAG: hypothetical protein A2324_14790 [Candidatus Raymondbacteria bacterium RIFOXYB2_FULL_49_35]
MTNTISLTAITALLIFPLIINGETDLLNWSRNSMQVKIENSGYKIEKITCKVKCRDLDMPDKCYNITIPGCIYGSKEAGEPQLPKNTIRFGLLDNSEIDTVLVNITSADTLVLDGYVNLFEGYKIESKNAYETKDADCLRYFGLSRYPESAIYISKPHFIYRVKHTVISFSPVIYFPKENKIVIHKCISLTIRFKGDLSNNNAKEISRKEYEFLKGYLVNFNSDFITINRIGVFTTGKNSLSEERILRQRSY